MIDKDDRQDVNDLADVLEEHGWVVEELTMWNDREITIDLWKDE